MHHGCARCRRGHASTVTTEPEPAGVEPTGFSHVRLSVTDIHRSKAFYSWLFGKAPRSDFSDRIDEPGVREDPQRTFGGCSFTVGRQVLGLRPIPLPAPGTPAPPETDRFDPARVGLDHLCLLVETVAELHAAQARLDERGVPHGEITDLPAFGLTILSVQDPDDINLELAAPLPVAG